ncbi:MAG TPA: ATP-binding protein [Actinomycetota bacterium]
MKLRSRLVLAIGYVLLAVIVALTIPLAVNINRQVRESVGATTQIDALALGAFIGKENMVDERTLRARLREATVPEDITRIVVTDTEGIVLFDSDGEAVGRNFANAPRPEMQAALQGRSSFEVRYSELDDTNILVAAAPIVDEELVGAVRITRDFAEYSEAVRRSTFGIVLIGIAGLVAGIVIAFGLSGSLTAPIRGLADTAHRLGEGDLTARAGDVGSTAEVKELGETFDEMAARLERTVQAQREFVANASHQLRTPLTGMKLRLEAAIEQAPTEEMRRQLEAAETEVDRLSEIVDRLLVMSREIEQGVPTHVDLHDAVGAAIARWRERAAQAGASLEAAGADAAAQANPTDVDQILDNLLDNAIGYAPGAIELATGVEGSQAWLTVRDHGPGIPNEERERVVERFYRGTGAPSGGSGLGLAIARELAEKWNGSLAVQTPDDGGTLVRVEFRAI